VIGREDVSEMTYSVSSGTLNPTKSIPSEIDDSFNSFRHRNKETQSTETKYCASYM